MMSSRKIAGKADSESLPDGGNSRAYSSTYDTHGVLGPVHQFVNKEAFFHEGYCIATNGKYSIMTPTKRLTQDQNLTKTKNTA
jgi:hypothetical protein